jgi:hypothetical protein
MIEGLVDHSLLPSTAEDLSVAVYRGRFLSRRKGKNHKSECSCRVVESRQKLIKVNNVILSFDMNALPSKCA